MNEQLTDANTVEYPSRIKSKIQSAREDDARCVEANEKQIERHITAKLGIDVWCQWVRPATTSAWFDCDAEDESPEIDQELGKAVVAIANCDWANCDLSVPVYIGKLFVVHMLPIDYYVFEKLTGIEAIKACIHERVEWIAAHKHVQVDDVDVDIEDSLDDMPEPRHSDLDEILPQRTRTMRRPDDEDFDE